MATITANSTPVYSGTDEWGIAKWAEWHKALVRKYNTQSVLVKSGDKTFGSNKAADDIWLSAYSKTTLFSKPRNELGNPLNLSPEVKNARKYLSMWAAIGNKTGLILQQYDPSWTGVNIAAETGEAVADTFVALYKIVKWTAIIGGSAIVVLGSIYVYNKVTTKTVKLTA